MDPGQCRLLRAFRNVSFGRNKAFAVQGLETWRRDAQRKKPNGDPFPVAGKSKELNPHPESMEVSSRETYGVKNCHVSLPKGNVSRHQKSSEFDYNYGMIHCHDLPRVITGGE